MSEYFMKKPCAQCPYRHDVKPFLTPARGEELAYIAQNPYNSFTCHKTLGHDEDGETCHSTTSKECAGFLTLMASELGEERVPEGFQPSYDLCYSESWDMAGAYEEAWESR